MASQIYFTDKLKQHRESKGWTQQETADLLDLNTDQSVSFSYYQKLESATKPVPAELALEVARFFRIDLKELVVRK